MQLRMLGRNSFDIYMLSMLQRNMSVLQDGETNKFP